jgi:hypothetical protein
MSFHDKKKYLRDRECVSKEYILTLAELYESNHGGYHDYRTGKNSDNFINLDALRSNYF